MTNSNDAIWDLATVHMYVCMSILMLHHINQLYKTTYRILKYTTRLRWLLQIYSN